MRDSVFRGLTSLFSTKTPTEHVFEIDMTFLNGLRLETPTRIPDHVKDIRLTQTLADSIERNGDLRLSPDDSSKRFPLSADTFSNLPYLRTIQDNAFRPCIGTVTLQKLTNLTRIGKEAFKRVNNITLHNLPALKTIDDMAFQGADVAVLTDLPRLERIGKNAFENVTKINLEDLTALQRIDNAAFHRTEDVTLKNLPKLTTIGLGAFYMCVGVELGELDALTTIGDDAFHGNPNPLKLKTFTHETYPNLVHIGNDALPNNKTLNDLNPTYA